MKKFEPIGDQIQNVIDNPFAKMGMQYTQNKFQEMIDQNQGFISSWVFNPTLKKYYDVDQSYIL